MEAVCRDLRITNSVHVTDKGTTLASPEIGIRLNRKQLASIRRRHGEAEFLEILRWILAHEHTHLEQFARYGATAVLNDPRRFELEADLLGGFKVMMYYEETLALNRRITNRADRIVSDLATSNKVAAAFQSLELWINLCKEIEGRKNDPSAHPPFNHRVDCLSLGLNSGGHYFEIELCQHHRRRGNMEQLERRKEKVLERANKLQFKGLLPTFDADTLVVEELWSWSDRISSNYLRKATQRP